MKNNEILFAGENESVIIPSKRIEDGAFDIYANFEEDYMIIPPHTTVMIPTGLRSAFSSDYVAILKERGSNGVKGIAQRAGVIDSGFRGIWQVPLTNTNELPLIIIRNDNNILYEINGNMYHNKQLIGNVTNIIKYPYEKAVCQCIMVEVPKLQIRKATKEEIMNISSERGEGMLGSSQK